MAMANVGGKSVTDEPGFELRIFKRYSVYKRCCWWICVGLFAGGVWALSFRGLEVDAFVGGASLGLLSGPAGEFY